MAVRPQSDCWRILVVKKSRSFLPNGFLVYWLFHYKVYKLVFYDNAFYDFVTVCKLLNAFFVQGTCFKLIVAGSRGCLEFSAEFSVYHYNDCLCIVLCPVCVYFRPLNISDCVLVSKLLPEFFTKVRSVWWKNFYKVWPDCCWNCMENPYFSYRAINSS